MNTNEFILNRSAHSLQELEPYIEQHVAWSLDGKQVLAHAKEMNDLFKELDRLGLRGGDYVLDFVPDPDVSFLGGGSIR